MIAGIIKAILAALGVAPKSATPSAPPADPPKPPVTAPADPRSVYLAVEAERSRARRARKVADRTRPDATGRDRTPRPDATGRDRTRPDAHENLQENQQTDATGRDRTRPDAPLIKEEYIKTVAQPISEKWWPDPDGYQLGVQAFGTDGVDAAIAIHVNTWLSRPVQLTDRQWAAKWRAWCQLHIAPSLPLGPTELAVRRGKKYGRDRPPAVPAQSLHLKQECALRSWIRQDSPQWEAWQRHLGKSIPVDRDGGWSMPSEWPPEQREASNG
jgi:hypothetical protein